MFTGGYFPKSYFASSYWARIFPVTLTRQMSWAVRAGVALSRAMSWTVRAAVGLTRVMSWAVDPPWARDPNCPVIPGTSAIFRRVTVDYLQQGGARVSFELDRHFIDPQPHAVRLLGSHSGVDTADDWQYLGAAQQNVFFLVDPARRMYGKTATWHFRVELTSSEGTYYSPVASVLGKLDEHGFQLVREITRKEVLRHRIFGSVPALLLKAKRYGTICPVCVDPLTGEISDADCPTCLGTGYENGFYDPVECQFADVTNESTRESRNIATVGTDKPVVVKGRFIGFPPLIQGDVVLVKASDERYFVHSTTELATWRSVPIVVEAELRLIPFSSPIYNHPV